MDRLKICEMIDRPFLGGGQRNLLDLALHLDRTRFDVTVCSAAGGPMEDLLEEHGIRFQALPLKKKLSRRLIGLIRAFLDREGFHLLHTHGGVAGFLGRWAARRGPVCVHTLHGIHYLNYRNPFLREVSIWQERFLSRTTSAVICVSEADKALAAGNRLAPPSILHVIKNGIDFDSVRRSADTEEGKACLKGDLGIDPDSPILGTVARLHHQKGIPDLLKAMALVVREFPAARLVIVGDGPEEAGIRRMVRDLGLDRAVFLLGERRDARRLLNLFDVFILSSLWEGLPYVLLEAAALSKPVISTAAVGVAEVIKDGDSGLLVPVSCPSLLAEGAARLLRDRALAERLGRNLYASASAPFSLDRMIGETRDLYLRVLN
jgi:glycosyltransferase involved in cell wall biosynthesis